MRPATPYHRVKHGTLSGYNWHKRHPEHGQPCPACRKANAEASKLNRDRRRRQKIVLRQILTGGQSRKGTKLSEAEYKEIMKTIKEDLDAC